ncbi:hypothetical protein KEJ39_02780 [Candidatus Bathyarchaeota archaeon]|nr:hypothetical protein [Candidatus Bathyarchaeota archaeon]
MKRIDYYGAMILLSEIGDIKLFPSPRKTHQGFDGPSVGLRKLQTV